MTEVCGTTGSTACGNGGVPASTRGRAGSSVVARRPARRQSSHRHRADRPPPTTARACGDLSSGKWVKDPPMFVEHGRQDKQYSSKEASKRVPKYWPRKWPKKSPKRRRKRAAEWRENSAKNAPGKSRKSCPQSCKKMRQKVVSKLPTQT